ncbi:hypothetical protein J4470_02865 [Candidatus Woesearchaeota archaeon]|nr:hypothetical protein [Candidatus Woesearchaeota archaeon]
MKNEKSKKGKFDLPADTNPVELADELKRGITVKLLSDLEELRKRDFRKGKGVTKAEA